MMNNNKILTVSYGTFSCTLEGFEDSFGTMKAIAEYFRDLAADDRYFGAEPPQPDAEMLARIAQKEVSRRVQARNEDGQIVLSALEDQREAPAAPAQPAAPVMETPEAPVATAESAPVLEDVAEEPAVDAPQQVEVDDAVSDAAPMSLHIVETEPQALAIEEAEMDFSIDLSALDDIGDAPAPAAAEIVADEEVHAFFADSTPDPAVEDEDTVEAVAEAETAAEAEPQPEPAKAEPAPAPDSIAAKLQRIRAVVAQHEEREDDDYLEDEHADQTAAKKASDAIAEARADLSDAMAEDEAVAEAETAEAEEEDDELDGILSRLDAGAEAPVAVEEDVTEEDDADDDAVADSVSNLFDEEDEQPEQEDTHAEQDEDDVSSEDLSDPEEDAVEETPRARVIKVKRAELEAAIEKGDLEEYDDEAEDEAPRPRSLDDMAPSKRAQTALSQEDEDDLARELAALEDDIAAEDDEDAKDVAEEEDAPVAARAHRNGRAKLPTLDGTSDVSRLLAESDHQMDEPESATRRDAFAHLRAAVAAKKADSTIEDDEAPKGVVAYREDLAEVVRPRRPAATTSRTERPDDARPAPLKLVAEQRIDIEKPKAAGPVRPRRVAAVAEPATEAADGESFADFAADMGATTLPDLLEAAAAYLSFVEGREQFSRPQLMTKVRQVNGDDGFSREEGLRSFGQLLRAGKIEKIKGGRFTVSDDIGFRPDERAAG